MTVGVLALQGAVREHLDVLRGQGAEAVPVRTPAEVAACDALILPGGESTTIGKLMDRYALLEPIRYHALSGKPLLGTCAGMILMANGIAAGLLGQPALRLMDIFVERNAFGRQQDSFEADLEFKGVEGGPVRAVFIRAPTIKRAGEQVEVLATYQGNAVAARQGNLLALAFHPELTSDPRVHQYFLSLAGDPSRASGRGEGAP